MKTKAQARKTYRPFFLVLAIGIVASCTWDTETDFDDFDGVNLIANQGFGSAEASSGAPWFLTPGLTTATNTQNVDYAKWELSSETGSYAPPEQAADGRVFRLETVNLFQNGDFEDGIGGWINSGTGSSNEGIDNTTPINGGQSLVVDFESPQTRLHTDLTDTTDGLVDGFEVDVAYAFHIDFRLEVDLFRLELNNNTDASTLQTWSVERGTPSPTTVFAFPGRDRAHPAISTSPNTIVRSSVDSDKNLLSFGGINEKSQFRIEGTFDNIRFVRSNQAHYLRLPVPFKSSGRPELSSGGSYTFSVWVKADPAALDTGDTGFGNRFPARHLSVGIDKEPTNATARDIVYTNRLSLSTVNNDPTQWHQLSWEIPGNGITVPFQSAGSDTIFDIVIETGSAISGPTYQDAGSILLTAPSLTWKPE